MKTLILSFLMLTVSSFTFAQGLDAKATLNKYAELSRTLGYNDGSTLSLQLQEYRGPFNAELFKIYKESNDKLTAVRPQTQKELDKMDASFNRNIANRECLQILGEVKSVNRSLGYIKGLQDIVATNEQEISQRASEKHLADLTVDLMLKALASCKDSLANLSDL